MTYEIRRNRPQLLVKGSHSAGEQWWKYIEGGVGWFHCSDHKGPWVGVHHSEVPAEVVEVWKKQARPQ